MEVKVKALDSFCHGPLHAHIGAEYPMQKATADELVKAGLVEILPTTDTTQTGVTDSQEDLDDLVGGEKMAEAPENKMEPAVSNKTAAVQKPKK